MTSTTARGARLSPLFLTLACITLALASWGLFGLLRDFGGAPFLLALIAVGGLDLVAVACGKHALDVATDGDSAAPWNVLLLLFTALGAYAQFEHGRLSNWPLVLQVVMAAFPVATVVLFEGQLRRRYRLRGRAAGRLAEPRATQDFTTWIFAPGLALTATRLAALDRGLDADSALTLAEAARRRQRDAAAQDMRPRRRTMRRSYAELVDDGTVIELDAGQAAGALVHVPQGQRTDVRDNGADIRRDSGADSGGAPDIDQDSGTDDGGFLSGVQDIAQRRVGRQHGATADAVRTVLARHPAADVPLVVAEVKRLLPGAEADTIRRTMNRLRTGTGRG